MNTDNLGIGLLIGWLGLLITIICNWIYGAVICFKASVILGIVGLFIPPLFPVASLVKIITGTNIALWIVSKVN